MPHILGRRPHTRFFRGRSSTRIEPPFSHVLIYQWQEEVEDLEGYHVGGYHPVRIGDVYSDGRYRVVHKLGFGSYSTVWLARDSQLNRYVALKIIVAEASKDTSENRILRHLQQTTGESSIRHRFVTSLLDEFYLDGPNGRHLCLATEPARCSIAASKEGSIIWMFPLEVARAISAQAILGLQSIHSRGVIHGDLHVRNILLALPQIDAMSVDEIYEHFNQPRETKVERLDGGPLGPEVPSYTVLPAKLVIVSDELSDPRTCISDFGEAWLSQGDQPKQDLQTPVLFLPPEAIFAKSQLGSPADIWTLACSIYEIMGERPLFEGFMPDRDDIAAEMVSCLGPLPRPWWEAWQARGEFFNEDGSWRTDMTRPYEPKSRSLLLRLQKMGRQKTSEFSTAEMESLEKMLRTMLEYDPRKRATADEVIQSEWMIQWGLPSLRQFDIPE